MLYKPGFHFKTTTGGSSGGTADTLIASMRADTTDLILNDWGDTITVQRKNRSWNDSNMAVETWSTNGTIYGDFQAVDGNTIREEIGRRVKSIAVIFCAYDADIQENDRIVFSGETYYVNYTRVHEDHMKVYLKSTENQL